MQITGKMQKDLLAQVFSNHSGAIYVGVIFNFNYEFLLQ